MLPFPVFRRTSRVTKARGGFTKTNASRALRLVATSAALWSAFALTVPGRARAQCVASTVVPAGCNAVNACCTPDQTQCWYEADGQAIYCSVVPCDESTAQQVITYCAGMIGTQTETTPGEPNVRSYKKQSYQICTDTCAYPNDLQCDDGREGSYTSLCEAGTDCTDCGVYVATGGCSVGTGPAERDALKFVPLVMLGLLVAVRRLPAR
jgi:hypothetical protein